MLNIKLTYDWLFDQYIIQNKTVKQISKEFNLSYNTIAHKLSDLGIHREKQTPYKDKDWLYEKYIIQNIPTKDIAKICNVLPGTIVRYCNKFGILKKDYVFTKDFLYQEHIIKHKSISQIMKETNSNTTTVRRYLELYNVPVWTCHDNTNQYIDNNDGTTTVMVYDQYGKYVDKFTIDTDKVDEVKKYKWVLQKDKIVKDREQFRVCTGSHPTMILGRYLLDLDDSYVIDHKDTNPLNNCMNNLRIATRSQNQANHSLHTNNISGFAGVVFLKNKKKWHAQIKSEGITYHLGNYQQKCDAVYARYIAEQILFKEFRNTLNDFQIYEIIKECCDTNKIEEFVSQKIDCIKHKRSRE